MISHIDRAIDDRVGMSYFKVPSMLTNIFIHKQQDPDCIPVALAHLGNPIFVAFRVLTVSSRQDISMHRDANQ